MHGSEIKNSTINQSTIGIDLSDDNQSKTTIAYNKINYVEYGKHSIKKNNVCSTANVRKDQFSLSTEVSEVEEELAFEIFPNPVQNSVYIYYTHHSTEGMVQIEIRTISGQLTEVLYQNMTDENQGINIRYDNVDLKVGIYVVKVIGEGFVESRKFVKVE